MNKRFIAIVLTVLMLVTLFALPVGAATKKATPKPVVNNGLGKIGMINIAGTKIIKLPIVVAKDNKWYLDKGATGKRDVNGAIFMDYRNRDLSRRRNIILYGHNMRSGKMFATLHYFRKKATFDKYSAMTIELFNRKYDYEIIIAGQFNIKEFNHTRTQFASNAEFKSFLDTAVSKATFVKTGYSPKGDEEIITLSTCVSHSIKNYKDYKWVVIARRVKDNGLVSAIPLK